MGYAGKLKEKRIALKLRGRGLSYKEILEKVSVSKSTLSYWCRDVILSPEQLGRLQKRKLKGAERGRIIGAKTLQNRRILETKKLIKLGKKEVGQLSKRDLFIAGIGLYLGDGYKGDKEVGFSNSNPKIIKFMMSWFRKYCKISEEKFRGQIWIHENRSEKSSKKYWSKITKIPLAQFRKSYIAENKTNSRKIRKKIHNYGIFAIRVNSCKIQRKILGWNTGILGEPLI